MQEPLRVFSHPTCKAGHKIIVLPCPGIVPIESATQGLHLWTAPPPLVISSSGRPVNQTTEVRCSKCAEGKRKGR